MNGHNSSHHMFIIPTLDKKNQTRVLLNHSRCIDSEKNKWKQSCFLCISYRHQYNYHTDIIYNSDTFFYYDCHVIEAHCFLPSPLGWNFLQQTESKS
jgi:hypothetical protein